MSSTVQGDVKRRSGIGGTAHWHFETQVSINRKRRAGIIHLALLKRLLDYEIRARGMLLWPLLKLNLSRSRSALAS